MECQICCDAVNHINNNIFKETDNLLFLIDLKIHHLEQEEWFVIN